MKKFRSKFFRVAVEGDTTDGRVIEGNWIRDMAATYDPNLYGARINLEHIRGIVPDSPFKSYGDVVALKAEQVDIGGQKKLALFAQLEPTDALVSMVNNDQQKIYTSIEIAPNFAKTGKAYLYGLAVTDSPASLGTEKLAFSAKHPEIKLYEHLKHLPDNLITASSQAAIELEEVSDSAPDAAATLLTSIATFMDRLTGKAAPPSAPPARIPPPPEPTDAPPSADLSGFSTLLTEISGHLKTSGEQFTALRRDLDESRADHAALLEKLSSTASTTQPSRPPVSGNSPTAAATDC